MKLSTFETIQIIIAFLTFVVALVRACFEIWKIIHSGKESATSDKPSNNKSASSSTSKKTVKPKKKSIKIKITLSLIAIVLIAPGANTFYYKYYIDPFLEITNIVDNQVIGDNITVIGTYRNINFDEQVIWIVVFSQSDLKYFPSNSPAIINIKDKKWTNDNTEIGAPSDTGKEFKVLALLIEKKSKAFAEITQYLSDISRHGLDKLPFNIPNYDEVKVLRK